VLNDAGVRTAGNAARVDSALSATRSIVQSHLDATPGDLGGAWQTLVRTLARESGTALNALLSSSHGTHP
jgi:hypothetical protein